MRVLACVLLAFAATTAAAEELPTFDIHFVVLTRNAGAQRVATLDQLRREVDILNSFFVSATREPLVRFRFKSATLFQESQKSGCKLKDLGDNPVPLDTSRAAELFNACDDPNIRDPRAINFYIYDAYAPVSGFKDATGHGRRNSDRPFVFLDWQRLNHGDQAAEEHEMGHAFGLEHICVPGATRRTPTNIMSSADCGKGSGGLRNLGFNEQQAATVLRNAQKIRDRLR
ncbi:MAG: hypothetical protein ABL878_20500 [Burkholderiales bacterium]